MCIRDSVEGRGWRFRGKIDRIVRNTRSGTKYIWDLKTPGTTGPAYFQRLPLDSQLKGYVLGAQRGLGHDVTYAVYDVVQKPSGQKTRRCDDPEEWAEEVGTQYLVGHERLFSRVIIEYP